MRISVVLADANILFSRTLRDDLLHVADAGAIEIHWSQQILDEMSRNLRARILEPRKPRKCGSRKLSSGTADPQPCEFTRE